jgi:hypothetical protein
MSARLRRHPHPGRVAGALASAALGALLVLLAPPAARGESHTTTHTYSYGWSDTDSNDRFGWALFDPRDRSMSCSTDTDELADITADLAGERSKVLWFRLDGDPYVLRDRDLVRKAEEILAPMREIGEKQGKLGHRQGELGRRQGELGRRQGELGARQAALSLKLARLSVETDAEGDREARREARAIQDRIDAMSAEQAELGRQQAPLAREQGELGRQQGELGQQMSRESRRAGEALRRLAEEAVRDGRAQPMRTHRSI